MKVWTALSLGLTATLCVLADCARAQDPVFSQHTASPVYANPALAGLYEGELRLIANYRDQWGSVFGSDPIRTFAASAELRYNTGGKDYVAVSATALQDQGGVSAFRTTRAGVGLAVQKYLDGGRGRNATYLGFGARVGFGQQAFDPSKLWYSSNFDSTTVTVNPGQGADGLAPGFVGQTRVYLDITGGLNLSVVRRDYSFVAGISAHHINSPEISFVFDDETRLDARYSAMVGGEYLIEDELRLMPSATFELQGQMQRLTTGAALYYKPDSRGDAGFRAGLYGRLTNQYEGGMGMESIIVAGAVEINRMTIGMSYDINVGDLGRTTDGRGAYELSLAWTREGKSRYDVICPKL